MNSPDVKKALLWANKNLVDKVFYHPELKKKIRFTPAGIKHAVSAKTYPRKIAFIYELPTILDKAILIDSKPDYKKRKTIKQIHVLYVSWKWNDEKYFVRIILREQINGVIYYDHVIIKKKND